MITYDGFTISYNMATKAGFPRVENFVAEKANEMPKHLTVAEAWDRHHIKDTVSDDATFVAVLEVAATAAIALNELHINYKQFGTIMNTLGLPEWSG